jgi:hypothetical protein
VEHRVKVLIKNFGYFLSISQQGVSADIIQNSAVVKTSPQKQKEQLFSDVFSLPVHFDFFAIFSYCLHFAKFVSRKYKSRFRD